MSVFSDEELKLLKGDIELANRQPCPMIHIDTDTQSALLARLEAAEKAMLTHINLEPGFWEHYAAWKKVAGK